MLLQVIYDFQSPPNNGVFFPPPQLKRFDLAKKKFLKGISVFTVIFFLLIS